MTNTENKKSLLYLLTDKKYHIHRHLLLQLFALIYAADVFCLIPGKPLFSTGLFFTFLAFYLIFNLIVYPNAYILVPRYLAKRKVLMYILSVIILIAICLFIMALVLSIFEKDGRGVLRITHSRNVFLIMWAAVQPFTIITFALQIGAVAAFVFFRKWLIENQRTEELKVATLDTELKFLKSQINPHFLFNMLNNANILMDDDPDRASLILTRLDDLLRYQMNDSILDKVYLRADIAFLRDFIELEKTRRDNFEYTISEEGSTNNVQVAPLLFIPFVENAVKHNFDSQNPSYVNLSFIVRENKLTFICENSIPQREIKREVGGIGLVNIKRRLELLYKDRYVLQQTKSDNAYIVTLELNL